MNEEAKRVLPGDDEIKDPIHIITHAVTIRASSSEIWPWLVQMGYRRGGMYSYDCIDRLLGILDRPSSNRILPEFQHLAVGDIIPMGRPPSWPVKAIEPNRLLLILINESDYKVSWCFLLDEINQRQTRLNLRIRYHFALSPILRFVFPVIYPGEFLMIRKMLLGIKRRAESTIKQR